MANTIQIKRKTTTGAPSVGTLADGELCLNTADGVLYQRVDGSTLLTFLPAEVISQAAYDALSPPDDNKIYLITS